MINLLDSRFALDRVQQAAVDGMPLGRRGWATMKILRYNRWVTKQRYLCGMKQEAVVVEDDAELEDVG